MPVLEAVKPPLFEEVPCPVCGWERYRILKRARYPEGISFENLSAAYSASSDHALLDQLVECGRCGLGYLNPRPAAGIIASAYSSAADPVFVAQNPERIRTFARALAKITRRLGMQPRGLRLLDAGCAGGAFVAAACDAGFAAEGIEPSHWLARYGREQYGLTIRQGLLEPGVFETGSFDVVTLWDVIEHLPVPGDVLATIRTILKPGGWLWVNYPDAGSWAARLMGSRWPFYLSVHLLYYTRRTMRFQLEQAGFEVVYQAPHWQSLKLGYLTERAAVYAPGLRALLPLWKGLGLRELPLTYQLGQTLAVARKLA